MNAVEIEGVTVRYGRRTALDAVTLSLPQTATGLLGPNGAGKSTLMKALLGYLRPDAGTLRVLGMDMATEPLAVRHRLGYMPERDLMSPKVSAVSFLVYCGRLHGMTRPDAMERAHAVLNYVGLGEARYRKMETYSKGMCQRVKFAQAIIHDPKLLLLDEPTNGLDPEGRAEMLELIGDLARERGIAVVLSTHLLPDVQAVCEYLAIIHEGRVVRAGAMNELTAYRGGEVEIRVHSRTPEFAQALERAGCTVKLLGDGTLRVVKPGRVAVRQLFVVAREQGTHVRQLKPIRQSLEDTFLEAIGHRDGAEGNGKPPAPRQLGSVRAAGASERRG